MQKWLFNILAIALSVNVVFSTTSFSVYQHFCGAFLQDVSLLVPGDGCGMEMSGGCSMEMDGYDCCDDHQEVVKGQDDLRLDTIKDFEFQPFYASTSISFDLVTADQYETRHAAYLHKRPPPPKTSYYILYESFLI